MDDQQLTNCLSAKEAGGMLQRASAKESKLVYISVVLIQSGQSVCNTNQDSGESRQTGKYRHPVAGQRMGQTDAVIPSGEASSSGGPKIFQSPVECSYCMS